MCSWQVWLHGGQLRPQTKRGVRVPHHNGGSPKRDAGPRHLPYQVQVHRWRQKRSPVLGMEPRYQEGLEGLIFFDFFSPLPTLARWSTNVFLCFVSAFLFFLPSFPPPPGYWIVSVFCSLRPSACSLLSCGSIYFPFLLNSNHFIIPPIATLIDFCLHQPLLQEWHLKKKRRK